MLTSKPLNEPVSCLGPIIMNTQGQLETAFREHWNGTILKNRQTQDHRLF
jgi:redox-sensitive bicupin YhaK (pirin superfamily)